jgi:glycosyltransferase involved in cell wall biosynthesis
MKQIRVAHITTIDFSLRHLLLNQLLSLKEAGFDVTGISASGPDVEYLREHGIRHIAVPMSRSITPARDAISLLQLYNVLRREKFDIVHTHNPKPGFIGQVAARMAGTPIIVNTLHGFYFHEHMRKPERHLHVTLERIAGRLSDAILSQNSEDMHTAVVERVCPAERIKFLGNGIDLQYFDRSRVSEETLAKLRIDFGIPDGARVVGYVGRLVREKGIRELLDAIWCVKRNNIDARALLIGPIDRHKKDAITPDIAREYGIEDMCIFTGMRYDMPELYALMDVFVLPSYREGFPRAPMEAAAMGVPVIATNIRGCREAVVHEKNGLLVPPRSGAHLAATLLDVLRNDHMRGQFAANARPVAEELFDERKVFETVRIQYHSLLSRKAMNGFGGATHYGNGHHAPAALGEISA